jgi:hypothetical protein
METNGSFFSIQAFIASTHIEETKLSHAELPRSESRSFESDLLGGWKGQFFEVPHIIMRDMDDHQKDEYDLVPVGRD